MSQSRSVPKPPTHHPEAHHYLIGCGLSAVSGFALAVQSRINGDYGHAVRNGLFVALISFGSSLVLCLVGVAFLATRHSVRAFLGDIRINRLAFWFYLGGILGAYTIFSQAAVVTALGVAVYTVAAVAGQSLSSLLVDRIGVGPAGRQPLTWFRLTGAALAIVAVIVAVSGRLHGIHSIALAALPALAGIGTPFHQALNGRIRMATGSTLAATTVNFLVGVVALVIAFGIDVAVRGLPADTTATPWPAYVGGLLGLLFIAISVTVVRFIGVLLLALATIAGQLVMAIILDVVAPEANARPDTLTYVGTALTIVAVAVAAARRRQR